MREEKSMREICGESDQMRVREPPAGCGSLPQDAGGLATMCFILSFCLSDSRLKGQGYTIPTEKDLFPWRRLNLIIFWLVYK
jgi:hypothetical protein